MFAEGQMVGYLWIQLMWCLFFLACREAERLLQEVKGVPDAHISFAVHTSERFTSQ